MDLTKRSGRPHLLRGRDARAFGCRRSTPAPRIKVAVGQGADHSPDTKETAELTQTYPARPSDAVAGLRRALQLPQAYDKCAPSQMCQVCFGKVAEIAKIPCWDFWQSCLPREVFYVNFRLPTLDSISAKTVAVFAALYLAKIRTSETSAAKITTV